VQWTLDKDVEYTTETEDALKELIDKAKEEKYYDESKSDLNALANRLTSNQRNDLMLYKDQVKQILESEIVTRYKYQNGRMEYSLNGDKYIAKAMESFVPSTHQAILNGNN